MHGYDVFFDYESVKSGDFEQIISQNVKGRAHFLVVLTPSALERCNEPGDWLRREIELALEAKRNIVPLFLEGFSFGTPSIEKYLTGKLSALKKYNGLSVPADYFEAAMTRLRTERLNVALDTILHPISTAVQRKVQEQQVTANKAPGIKENTLTAQEWFEKGLNSSNSEDEIYCYNQAIKLQPDYAYAYINRGVERKKQGDLAGAIADYTEAIRLQPDDADAHNNRGVALDDQGDLAGALADYAEAIRLRPDYAKAYYNRGILRDKEGDLANAITDYTEAIRLQPDYASAYNGRGVVRKRQGDMAGAISDYTEAIRLQPDDADAYYNRGVSRKNQGDLAGAIADYTEAIRFKSDFANAYYNRGGVYKKKGNAMMAIADYQKYLDLGGGIRDGDQEDVEKIIRDLKNK